MKTIKLIIGLALIIGALTVLPGLTRIPMTTEVSVLWDITDTSIGKPKSDEIIRLYHLDDDNMWDGAKFRLSTLSNVNFNPTQELTLPIRRNWLSNELQRQKEIRSFESQIALLIDTPKTERLGRTNSSLYWPLFAELKRLSEQSGERRIMVIQSDLMENTADLSLYDVKQLEDFTTHPTDARFLTDNLSQMASLSGIEVYLLYQPKDARDSQRYTLISEVLKNLLQEKGAKVFRSANLNR